MVDKQSISYICTVKAFYDDEIKKDNPHTCPEHRIYQWLFSCGVDRWPEYAHQTALDTWMYDIMQQNYLWYQDLPSYDDVNLFLEPASFLSKVKSKTTAIRLWTL